MHLVTLTGAPSWETKLPRAVFRGGVYPLTWVIGTCASAAGCQRAHGWVNETLRGRVASVTSPLLDAAITAIKGFAADEVAQVWMRCRSPRRYHATICISTHSLWRARGSPLGCRIYVRRDIDIPGCVSNCVCV